MLQCDGANGGEEGVIPIYVVGNLKPTEVSIMPFINKNIIKR